MKRIVSACLLFLASLSGSCRSPIVGERSGADQLRFEQQLAGYPDRLDRRQETEASEQARKAEMLRQR